MSESPTREVAGVRLEAGCADFVESVCAASARLLGDGGNDIARVREVMELCRKPWSDGGPEMAATIESTVATAVESVRVRIYRPRGLGHRAPVLIYLHGGGWTLFSLNTHDRIMREYAGRAKCLVVGVDYSLAPENPYPAALEQVLASIAWVRSQPELLGVQPDTVLLGGDSAGGNLSLCVALRLRDSATARQVDGLLLNYPVTSAHISSAAAARYGGPGNMLTEQEMTEFWDNYVPRPEDRDQAYVAPDAADLSRLPPALFAIAECDVLAEQGIDCARRYEQAGNDTVVNIYRDAPHSFLEAVSVSPLAVRALDESAQWLQRLGAGGTVDGNERRVPV